MKEKISLNTYSFLKFLNENALSVDNVVFSEMAKWEYGLKQAQKIVQFFKLKPVNIYYIDQLVHAKLLEVDAEICNKDRMVDCPEHYGLLLLPETLAPSNYDPDFEVDEKQYKMNMILFAFITWKTHDEVMHGKSETHNREDYDDDADYTWEKEQYDNGRWLVVLPIQLDKVNFLTHDGIFSTPEEYGLPYTEYARDLYGGIVDYVWTFLGLHHFTDRLKFRRMKTFPNIHGTLNEIDMVEMSYKS